MTDKVQQFTPHIDRLFQREAAQSDEHSVERREYTAYWENPVNRQKAEFTLLLWDSQFNCYGIDYPFIRRLNFEKGLITFLYDGLRVTLKGRNLRPLYLRLSEHRPKHVHEFNSGYHEAVPEDATCIEAMTIQEE